MTRTLKEGRMTAPTLLWNPKFPIHLWKQMLPPSAAVEVTNVSPLAFHLVFFSSLAYSHSNRGRSVILVSVWVLCCMGVWSVRRENGGSWKERHFFSCYDRRWSAVSSAQFAGVILFFFFFFFFLKLSQYIPEPKSKPFSLKVFLFLMQSSQAVGDTRSTTFFFFFTRAKLSLLWIILQIVSQLSLMLNSQSKLDGEHETLRVQKAARADQRCNCLCSFPCRYHSMGLSRINESHSLLGNRGRLLVFVFLCEQRFLFQYHCFGSS